MPNSKVAPQELVTVLGDVFIDYNKMDEETDGEAIVAPTAQGTSTNCHTRKPNRKDPEFEPHGVSVQRRVLISSSRFGEVTMEVISTWMVFWW